MKSLGKAIVRYFLQGLVLVVPVVTTGYILYLVFVVVDDLLPWKLFPGSGILIVFTLVTFLGIIGNTVIAKPIKAQFQKTLNRAPLIKTIYTAITDMLDAVVGKRKRFNQPVLVKLSKESNIQKLGFITQKDLSELGIPEGFVSVYLPHSYNFSGNLFVVDQENVTLLPIKASEAMKFIVSGGVTQIDAEVHEERTT